MTMPGHVLALVDHPNLDVPLLPVLQELARRGHRVEALVVEHGRADNLRAAGLTVQVDPAALPVFLGATGPRLFLTAADMIPQHALGVRCELLCRQHGVPSLALEHAPFSLGHNDGFPPHLAFGADVMAVVGQEDARRYGLLGLDPRRLVVTGAPAMDGLTGMRDQARGSRGRGVTIFGQGHTWVGARSAQRCDADAWCAELASLYALLCARWPDTPLRIKPHPAEPAHGTAALYTRAIPPALAGRVQVLSTDTANRELILDSELVISFSSSVWLEARILDRAAVFLSLQQRTGRTAAHIEAMGGTWLPGRALDFTARFTPRLDELAACAVSRPPADEEILAAYAGPLDGRAAVRVADLAEELLASGPPDVDLPDLTFDGPGERPRLLRPQVSYAHYVHQQALAEEVMAAGVEQPFVLELAPEGSDLAAHLPLAFHWRHGEPLAGAPPVPAPLGWFDVVVAPDLWAGGLPDDPSAELTAMIALARRRLVFSVAAAAGDELFGAAAQLLATGDLDDALPDCRPDPQGLATLCRASGLSLRVQAVQNGASWCQSLLLENLGLDPEALLAVRRSLQAVGYPHEHGERGVRLVFTLSRPEETRPRNPGA